MSILVLESFDDGLYGSRHSGATGTVSGTYGAHGNGMQLGNTPGKEMVIGSSATSGDTRIIGFNCYLKETGTAIDYYVVTFSSTATIKLTYSVAVQADFTNNRWVITDRTGSTNSSNGTCLKNTWYYVELKVTFHDTTGSWDLNIDGSSVASATSRDTLYSVDPARVTLSYIGAGDATDEQWVDDIYLCDGLGGVNDSFLGPIEVDVLLPNGNGNYSNMTGSDSNQTDNYLLVDNNASAPPATTEYVGAGTVGDKDTYLMDDVTGTPVVVGMCATLYAAKTDTGVKFMRPLLRISSTDYPGTSVALSESYTLMEEYWDENPNTATTWLYGGINGMEVGQEVRDS